MALQKTINVLRAMGYFHHIKSSILNYKLFFVGINVKILERF